MAIGLAVILAPCNVSDATQHFSYDPTSKYIHPEANVAFCLDFEFDNKDLRPLTAFRCDKTFSPAAKPRHQEWEFFNTSNIKNCGTKKCIATGGSLLAGKRGLKTGLYEGKAVSLKCEVRRGAEPNRDLFSNRCALANPSSFL
jgi:hypothetical protein